MKIYIIYFLTQLKNAILKQHEKICVKSNNTMKILVMFLYKENLILSIKANTAFINVFLKSSNLSLNNLKLISTHKKNISYSYINISRLSLNINKCYIFSTTQGLLSNYSCKKQKIGGKLLFIC